MRTDDAMTMAKRTAPSNSATGTIVSSRPPWGRFHHGRRGISRAGWLLAFAFLFVAGCGDSVAPPASFIEDAAVPLPVPEYPDAGVIMIDSAPPVEVAPDAGTDPDGQLPFEESDTTPPNTCLESCDDGLACTTDYCTKTGVCVNLMNSDSCLVDGICYAEGDSFDDTGCTVCAPTADKTTPTFADGKPCYDYDSETSLDFCYQGVCKGFDVETWLPEEAEASTDSNMVHEVTAADARGVDFIPNHGFALIGNFAGKSTYYSPYGTSANVVTAFKRGYIAHLNYSGSVINTMITDNILFDIHGGVAVGAKGDAYLRKSGGWSKMQGLQSELGTQNIYSVWSRPLTFGGIHQFVASSTGHVARCAIMNNSVSCSKKSGIPSDAHMTGVVGIPNGGGFSVEAWGLQGGSIPNIFHQSTSTGSWSSTKSKGCNSDASTSACHLAGGLHSIKASNDGVLWAVGSGATVLRKAPGKAWEHLATPTLVGSPSEYVFRGVAIDNNMVMIVGYRNLPGSRQLMTLSYNRSMKAFFEPTLTKAFVGTDDLLSKHQLQDIATDGNGKFVAVGSRYLGATGQKLPIYLHAL
jgi:hypothetical protein